MYNYWFGLFIHVNLKIRPIYYSKRRRVAQNGFKSAKRICRWVKNIWARVISSAAAQSHLSDDGLSGLVIFVEEVVGLDEELAGVLLRLSHPLLPQHDGHIGAFISVKLLRAAPQMEKDADVQSNICTYVAR